MENNKLIAQLRSVSVETGSLVCFGCGHENNCGIHGCAILRAAADCMEGLREYEQTGLEPEEVLTGLELANVYAAMLPLKQYQSIGPVEEFRALKEAEQKRQNGCVRCVSCNTCYRFGWHPDICQKCENESHYSAKPFCSHCGRDLRGDNHENN